MDERHFGALLRRLRRAAQLSQEELAARAGLSVQAISALERGVHRSPNAHTLDALASALALDGEGRAALAAAVPQRRNERGRRALDRGGRPASLAAAHGPPSGSAALADLFGREQAYTEVIALVRHAKVRLLTIVGPGGVGKTRLALAVAQGLAVDFADGIAVVPLADLRDPAQVAVQIGRAVGLSDRARDLPAALAGYLRQRHLLVVLDNCEHLLAAAPLIDALLDACPQLTVLATSRAPLRLAPEHAYELAPLACPDRAAPLILEDVADHGAVALFVARAREVRPGFALVPANVAAVAAICVRLDGLPLALELAAARLAVLGPAELLKRLAARFSLLTHGLRDLPARQRTLRATLDWSHDLLDPGERMLFRRLAVFTGGVTLAAIEAVCVSPAPAAAELLDWLGGLVEQRLVRREFSDAAASPRFTMLETVREYAVELLAAHRDEEITYRQRQMQYYLALAEAAAPHLIGAEQEVWSAQLEAEHDNMRAGFRHALASGDAASALRLAAALWRFWYAKGYWSEARGWLNAALALPLSEDSATALAGARATVLRAVGGLATFQADFGPAFEALGAALDLARRAGDAAGEATALDYLAILAKEQGDYRAAADLHTEALAARRVLGVARDIAATVNNLGGVYEALGDYRRAVACFTEGLALSRASGDTHTMLMALTNLGNATQQLGDYAQARALNGEGLVLARRLGEGRFAAIALTNLGAIALDQGEPAMAAAAFHEAVELARPLAAQAIISLALANLGEALRLLGRQADAEGLIAEGLALAEVAGDDWAAAVALVYRGALAASLDDHRAALADYRGALARFRLNGVGWGIAASLNRLGSLTPDPAEAAACFRESLERSIAMAHQLLGATASEGLALTAGDPEQTIKLLAAAEALRARCGTPREPGWSARCARAIDSARAALGDDAFAECWVVGRTLDLIGVARMVGVVGAGG